MDSNYSITNDLTVLSEANLLPGVGDIYWPHASWIDHSKRKQNHVLDSQMIAVKHRHHLTSQNMVQAEQVLGRFLATWNALPDHHPAPFVHILDVFSTYLVYLAEL